MNHFTVGDKVTRIGNSNGRLKQGETYTVKSVLGDGYIELEEVPLTWLSSKFAAAVVKKVKPVKGSKRDYVSDHARRTLRKVGFQKDVAAELVAELTYQNEQIKAGQPSRLNSVLQRAGLLNRDGTFNLSSISRSLPISKPVLVGALSWADTKRGFTYWDKVYATVANG